MLVMYMKKLLISHKVNKVIKRSKVPVYIRALYSRDAISQGTL